MTSYSRHEAALDGKQARNQWQAFHMLEDTDLLMNSSDVTTTKKTSTSLFVLGPDEEDGGGADEVGGAEEARSVAVCARLPRRFLQEGAIPQAGGGISLLRPEQDVDFWTEGSR